MKKILMILLVFISLNTTAQKDTIVTISNDSIFCQIKKITETEIVYSYKNYRKIISLSLVVYHTPEKQKSIYDFDIIDYDVEIRDINLRMDKHWEEYKKGLFYSISGYAVISLGAYIRYKPFDQSGMSEYSVKEKYKQKKYTGNTLMIIGSGMSCIGFYYKIHSHSVFGKKQRFTLQK